jgi:8-oxo-dGTP diphosphatase
MEVEAGTFAPNDEVDELVWVAVDEAAHALTYAADRELLQRAALGDATPS